MELEIDDVNQKKRGTSLETKLLEVRCMSKPKLFYLRLLPRLRFETNVFQMCVAWPH